jgi:hypothetical protein
LAQAIRRSADQDSDLLADVPSVQAFFATVVSVNSPKLTLSWRGSVIPGRHGASYTPGVGDWALFLIINNQPCAIDLFA